MQKDGNSGGLTQGKLKAVFQNMISVSDDRLGRDLFDTQRRMNDVIDPNWQYEPSYFKPSKFDQQQDF